MSEDADTTDWAQLVSLTDLETPPFLIGKNKFTIGRGRTCDVSHENNNLVSSTHCYILRDEDGKVWLYDSSTNGTLLNLKKIKLTKGKRHELEHGDEFFVVHKKGEEDVNVGYLFQDLARLKEEEEAENSSELDQTMEYDDSVNLADATQIDEGVNLVDETSPRSNKRKAEGEASPCSADPGPSCKRPRETATHTSKEDPESPSDPPATTSTANKSCGDKKDTKKEDEKDGKMEKEGEKKKEKGGGDGGEEDAIIETLTCIICQELLHDCISLQPCMHCFCAGCYSDWMSQSSECPSCRGKVDRINKNHIVNNLIEAYLKEHPDKKRPDEDLKELDAKNKITRDMLYPKNQRRHSDSEDYEDSDAEDDDGGNTYTAIPIPPPAGGTIFGFGTPVFGAATNAFRAVCRQCPNANPGSSASGIISSALNAIKGVFTGGQTTAPSTTTTTTTAAATPMPSTSGNADDNNNNNNNNNTDQAGPSGASPSGSGDYKERDKKTLPVAPDYQCAANQNHVLCQCCLQIFPDRRNERHTNPDIPPQQCTICYRAYCHAYWGCRKADCNGCLAKFKDMNFGRKILTGLILDNQTESDIFTRYLDSKEMAVRDVLEACLAKMAEGSYACADQVRFSLNGETPLCYACGLRNFKDLAYQFRAEIPNEDLPADARNRPNCYWGKNCRTQRNKLPHAMRFNHICEQTRT